MDESVTAADWNRSRAKANQGKSAQLGGRGFEGALEFTHDTYRRSRRADVFKLPVSTQPMPRSWLADPKRFGVGRILAERQRADYVGTFGDGHYRGRALAMEAKATTDRQASLPILRDGEKGFGLKLHQLEHLVRGWTDFGCVGVVVWKNGHERLLILPDILAWYFNEFRLGKVRRIQAVDAVPYLRGGFAGDEEDWLSPVGKWLEAAKPPGKPAITPE